MAKLRCITAAQAQALSVRRKQPKPERDLQMAIGRVIFYANNMKVTQAQVSYSCPDGKLLIDKELTKLGFHVMEMYPRVKKTLLVEWSANPDGSPREE